MSYTRRKEGQGSKKISCRGSSDVVKKYIRAGRLAAYERKNKFSKEHEQETTAFNNHSPR